MEFDDAKKRELLTNQARDKAEALLEGLMKAQAEAEADKDRLAQLTPQQREEGRLAMENAIASVKRMIENLNSALEIARDHDFQLTEGDDEPDLDAELSDDDLRELSEDLDDEDDEEFEDPPAKG